MCCTQYALLEPTDLVLGLRLAEADIKKALGHGVAPIRHLFGAGNTALANKTEFTISNTIS